MLVERDGFRGGIRRVGPLENSLQHPEDTVFSASPENELQA